MSELPRGWAKAQLGEVAEFVMGQAPPSSYCNKDGVGTPFVKAGEFGELRPSICEWTTAPLKQASSTDVLICVVGATCGKLNLGADCAIGRSVAAIRPSAGVEQLYLYNHLRTIILQLRQDSVGSAQGVISKEALDRITFPLPPLAEQRRILAKIDRLTARAKDAREELESVGYLAERYKQKLLAAAFKGALTDRWRDKTNNLEPSQSLVAHTPEPQQSRGGREATTDIKPGIAALSVNDPQTPLPARWSWQRLRRIARQETGHTPSRSRPEYWGGEFPWIGIRDAGRHHASIIHDTAQKVTAAGLANSSARLLPPGTVCLSRTASVGYVTIMGREMATSQDFATWTCTDALLPKYLMFALLAEGENIRQFGEGTTHTTIYFPEIRALHIALAPIVEQAEIVRRIELAFAAIDRLAAQSKSARALLDRLDQAILTKAFRGELVPQDPNDETANVLLDRIRAERADAPGSRARRRRTPK